MKKDYKQNYMGILLEDINSKFDLMMEILSGLTDLPEAVRHIDEKLTNIETDVSIMKSILTEHSKELKDHRSRLHKVETKVFN